MWAVPLPPGSCSTQRSRTADNGGKVQEPAAEAQGARLCGGVRQITATVTVLIQPAQKIQRLFLPGNLIR